MATQMASARQRVHRDGEVAATFIGYVFRLMKGAGKVLAGGSHPGPTRDAEGILCDDIYIASHSLERKSTKN